MPEALENPFISSSTWIQVIEPLLKEGHSFRLSPCSNSMYPFIMKDRDYAVVVAELTNLKRGNIVLFQRPDLSMIIHRIYKKKKDGFYIMGDNETMLELVRPEQIKAVAVTLIRNGKTISCRSFTYRLFSELWMRLRYVRPIIVKIRKFVYRSFGW